LKKHRIKLLFPPFMCDVARLGSLHTLDLFFL